jgi:subfamily B ATP-binding cassette protein HlyB/CyaB
MAQTPQAAQGASAIDPHLHLLSLLATLNGHSLSPARLARDFPPPEADPDALTAYLLRVLRDLGYQSATGRGSFVQLTHLALPSLVEGRDGRWWLLGRIDADPSDGLKVLLQRGGDKAPQSMDQSQFEATWSGRWIEVHRPQPASAPHSQAPKLGVGWFWNSLKKYKSLMGEVLLASLFVQVLALLSPLIFQVVIDKVLTHRSMSTLDVMLIALLGVSLFEIVLGALRHYLFSHTTHRIDVELGARLFRHLMRLPMSYFEARRSADTIARMRELENARNFLTGQALTSWLDLLFAAVFIAVMFYYSPTLSFIVLAALPIFFAASWLVTPLLRRKLEDKFALGAENQAFLSETVASMETLKAQAVELPWQREWERRQADYAYSAFHSGHLASATNQFIGLASKLLTAVLLWVGARQVIDGDLTVGGLIAFNMLSARVNAPILKLASLWQEFTQMKVSIKRLGDILDAAPEPGCQPGHSEPPALQGRVRLESVSFRYTPQAPEVLRELSFDVAPGEVIGIVGVSGAGKTTLIRLLQRLHAPERGRVLIDGIDLNFADTGWLRRQLGVVSQDGMLFNRSVRDNIALGLPQMPIEAVWHAAELAGVHEFVLGLPQGYDTQIGERGSRLSGGQRARIAIARALAHKPAVLLLDEATAALDYESERVVHDNLTRIAEGRTVFIVAHRLSTLRLADRILVLDQGQLVQQGSHARLMGEAGRYRELYRAHQMLDRETAHG